MIKPRLAGGVILGIAIGMAVGVGTYTFVYARGYSYMTDNPAACAPCTDPIQAWSPTFEAKSRRINEKLTRQ